MDTSIVITRHKYPESDLLFFLGASSWLARIFFFFFSLGAALIHSFIYQRPFSFSFFLPLHFPQLWWLLILICPHVCNHIEGVFLFRSSPSPRIHRFEIQITLNPPDARLSGPSVWFHDTEGFCVRTVE